MDFFLVELLDPDLQIAVDFSHCLEVFELDLSHKAVKETVEFFDFAL